MKEISSFPNKNPGKANVFLPSGAQLHLFSETVREDLRSIAIAVLRLLFYPVVLRYVAGRHRRRIIDSRISREDSEAKVIFSLEHCSMLASCMHSAEGAVVMRKASSAIKQALNSVDYRTFLRNECVQYNGEPSTSVLFLLSGTVRRCSTNVRCRRKSNSGKIGSFLTSNSNVTEGTPHLSCASSSRGNMRSSGLVGFSLESQTGDNLLHSPAVLGEYALVGGYPCMEHIVAESPLVLTACLSKKVYCSILEAVPRDVQKRMVCEALEMREMLLPRFAPMSCARMRLCPLLTKLSDEMLLHLMDYLVPQVRPAGMQINELSTPEHIMFIRRGVVHIRQDDSFVADVSLLTQPKSRCLLLEGHSFGERQCIFRESLGDSACALTNVDLYLLPFSVLVQFMKQEPEARAVIYASAKSASLLLEKVCEGIRFMPLSLDNFDTVLHFEEIARWLHRRVGFMNSSRTIPTKPGTSTKEELHPGGVGGSTGSGVSPQFLAQLRKIPLLSLCSPDDAFYKECASCWRLILCEAGDRIICRGDECNRLLLFPQGGAGVVTNEKNVPRDWPKTRTTSVEDNISRVPRGCIVGYTCICRHLWTHSVIALEDQVEVWELKRVVFIDLLRKHQLERKMQDIVLQLLQPLMPLPNRSMVLDFQPLLSPSPNSLWSECHIPNLHPVSLCESLRFPVWKEGDLPMDPRVQNKRLSWAVPHFAGA